MKTALRLKLPVAVALSLVACGSPDASGTEEAVPSARVASTDVRPLAAGGVLGTIEATVDGDAATWYVISGELGGQPYSAGTWYEPDPGSMYGVVGGFDTPDPPLETFEVGPSGMPESFGDFSGSMFSLTLVTSGDPGPYRVEFPTDDNPSSLVYLPEARMDDINLMYFIQSGVLEVTSLVLSDGRMHAEGGFSGTFENPAGDQRTIENGRFSVEGAPHLDVLTGQGSAG